VLPAVQIGEINARLPSQYFFKTDKRVSRLKKVRDWKKLFLEIVMKLFMVIEAP